MENKGVSLEVSKDVVREIVSAQISRQVLEALNGSEKLIEEMVRQVLSIKTTVDGRISNYGYENKYNFVEALCGNAIKETAQKLVSKWVEENTEAIQEQIVKQLNKKRTEIARSFVDAFCQSTKNNAVRIDVGIRPVGNSEREDWLTEQVRILQNRLKLLEGK